ncbi:hypothetical protein AAG589_21055 [Isoptericola sp. F-RaC21]|uniref:hypothetical protein n=1 Tax=Isoptericola sp. F-RaC21 TaxID=3141452 RepID=UPI00315C44BB
MRREREINDALRGALSAGARREHVIEADSDLPIAQLVRLDRPHLDYIVAIPVGRDRWAYTAVDVDGTRMTYGDDGRPEFARQAERWRPAARALGAMAMAGFLWWFAGVAGVQAQVVGFVSNTAPVTSAPAGSALRAAWMVILLTPFVVGWIALGVGLGRFCADSLLQLWRDRRANVVPGRA